MKNSIKHFLLPLVCGIAFISCEKQTTPEPVQIQRPELQSPIVRDDVYYARLRAYKKTDHKLAFGWFGSWTAINPSEQSRLRSAPDSMDIISIWSQWHSLSREQIEDKAFVQQVLGTKVVFCISAKDVPEEFKVDGQITDESLKDYARAWGKDSIDKYQYDGIDIDFETAADHVGPLSGNLELFKKFCEELSQYIGPKSGTGRLFLIDGNLESLDEGFSEFCNYGVAQAYAVAGQNGDRQLDWKFQFMEEKGWNINQMIFTENFESYWKTGGIAYDAGEDGIIEWSLLGMANYADKRDAAGFGAYHMEYEYGHSDMPYKYMRQAIQWANPAPVGDYTKNLLSIVEAGQADFDALYYPSGVSQVEGLKFEKEFSATLADAAASAVEIPLVVDNDRVAAYNDYYFTEYRTIDPSLVKFSGSFTFAKGTQATTTPVGVTIDDFSSLSDGEYMIALRADFSAAKAYSANTDKEYFFLKITKKTIRNKVSFENSGSPIEIKAVVNEESALIEALSQEISARLQYAAREDVTMKVKVDLSLVDAYNQTNGTNYAKVPAENVTLDGELTFTAGETRSAATEIVLAEGVKLPAGQSMIALRFVLGESQGDYETVAGTDAIYIILTPTVVSAGNSIWPEATSVEGTPIVDMADWKGWVGEEDCSSDMFNGRLGDMASDWAGNTATIKVDMNKSYTLAGFRLTPLGGYNDYACLHVCDVQTSMDGDHWENQSEGDVKLASPVEKWQYVQFIRPVKCRFIRVTCVSGADLAGCGEFNAIEAN